MQGESETENKRERGGWGGARKKGIEKEITGNNNNVTITDITC